VESCVAFVLSDMRVVTDVPTDVLLAARNASVVAVTFPVVSTGVVTAASKSSVFAVTFLVVSTGVVTAASNASVLAVTFPVVSAGVITAAVFIAVEAAAVAVAVVDVAPSGEVFGTVLDDEPCVVELLSASSAAS